MDSEYTPIIGASKKGCCYTLCQSRTARSRTIRKVCVVISKGAIFSLAGGGLMISGLITNRSWQWITGLSLLGVGIAEILGASIWSCRHRYAFETEDNATTQTPHHHSSRNNSFSIYKTPRQSETLRFI